MWPGRGTIRSGLVGKFEPLSTPFPFKSLLGDPADDSEWNGFSSSSHSGTEAKGAGWLSALCYTTQSVLVQPKQILIRRNLSPSQDHQNSKIRDHKFHRHTPPDWTSRVSPPYATSLKSTTTHNRRVRKWEVEAN